MFWSFVFCFFNFNHSTSASFISEMSITLYFFTENPNFCSFSCFIVGGMMNTMTSSCWLLFEFVCLLHNAVSAHLGLLGSLCSYPPPLSKLIIFPIIPNFIGVGSLPRKMVHWFERFLMFSCSRSIIACCQRRAVGIFLCLCVCLAAENLFNHFVNFNKTLRKQLLDMFAWLTWNLPDLVWLPTHVWLKPCVSAQPS